MKNTESNNQEQGSQDQKNEQKQYDRDKTQWQTGSEETGKAENWSSADKSNIAVDNEGRIGKAHDQWNNDNNNRNEQQQVNNSEDENNEASSDRVVNEPEIDAPIYEPEKTEKKIPRMEEQRKSQK